MKIGPTTWKVGDHIGLFEACSTFTGYYGLSARRIAYSDPFISKAPTVSFPPRVASIATGWSDPDAGQDLHLLRINTFYTAHKVRVLFLPGRGSGGMSWFVVELKAPSAVLFNRHATAFSTAANHGLNQLASYLHFATEKQAHIRDALEIPDFRTPQGVLIIGRESETLTVDVKKDLKAFWNDTLHHISILSYDKILKDAAQRLSVGT